MNREEILAGVERCALGSTISIGRRGSDQTDSAGEPVDHPRPTWEFVRRHLSEDLSGKTLLDVGCNAGFYCFEAARRGAARVVGVDAQRLLVRQARFVGRALGASGVEFEKMSVYDLDPARLGGQFDVTLALGLVYHCKHLVLALERLFRVTRELLILETAIFPPAHSPGPFVYPVGGLQSTLHPLAYVENPPGMKEAIYNWFLPSPDALRALLLNVGFDEVSVHPATQDDRAILVCRKHTPYPDSRALQFLSAITLRRIAGRARRPKRSLYAPRPQRRLRALAPARRGTARGRPSAAHLIARRRRRHLLYYPGRARARRGAVGRRLTFAEVARPSRSLRA